MAELISAKDLPLTGAGDVDLLCVDNGELKLKPADGLGGCVVRVPASDLSVDESSGEFTIKLSESYDSFAPVLYGGGCVFLDGTEALKEFETVPDGCVAYGQIMSWMYLNGTISGAVAMMGGNASFIAANGTWTPPEQ